MVSRIIKNTFIYWIKYLLNKNWKFSTINKKNKMKKIYEINGFNRNFLNIFKVN